MSIDFRAVKYLKLYSKCNRLFPETNEYFGRDESQLNELKRYCKKCVSNQNKERYQRKKQERNAEELKKEIEKGKDKLGESHPQMRALKQCSVCKEVFPATPKYFYTRDKGRLLASLCIECDKKRTKDYYQRNKEKTSDYQKIYYQENKEKILKQQKERRIKKRKGF